MPRKSRWARLPFGVRMTAGTSALLIAIGGGAVGIAALTKNSSRPRIVTAMGEAAQAPVPTGSDPDRRAPAVPPTMARMGTDAVTSRTAEAADRTATRAPRREDDPAAPQATAAAAPAPPPAGPDRPAITTRTDVETRAIPYETQLVRDPSLPRGTRRVQTPGVAGEETLRYLVTLTDGRETDRRLLDTTVTRPPQQQVIAFGGRRGRDRCGETLDFCVPLGRGGTCPHDGGDGRVEESATQLDGATIGVLDAELEVPAAGWAC